MDELLKDEKHNLSKKFNKLCERMHKDKEAFDIYMARGFKNINEFGWTYEYFKDICRSIYNINPCARIKYQNNVDSELNYFRKDIERIRNDKINVTNEINSM